MVMSFEQLNEMSVCDHSLKRKEWVLLRRVSEVVDDAYTNVEIWMQRHISVTRWRVYRIIIDCWVILVILVSVSGMEIHHLQLFSSISRYCVHKAVSEANEPFSNLEFASKAAQLFFPSRWSSLLFHCFRPSSFRFMKSSSCQYSSLNYLLSDHSTSLPSRIGVEWTFYFFFPQNEMEENQAC